MSKELEDNIEKEIKSIRVSLPYTTEEGRDTLREMTITLKRVVEVEKAAYNNGYSPIYKMGMSLVIPDHIHKRLLGSFVGRKRGLGDSEPKQYKLDFPKTITSESVSSLTSYYRDVIYDYRWLIRLDKMEVTKVIFYTFGGANSKNGKSYWDGKKMGSNTNVNYSYMVGYISSDGKTKMNTDKKVITRQDGEEINWKFINHTEERELFFQTIFTKFGTLLQQLNEFDGKINNKSIDAFIHSGVKLLN